MPCGGQERALSIWMASGQHPGATQFFDAGTAAGGACTCGSRVLRSSAGATVGALDAGFGVGLVTGIFTSFCDGTGLVAAAAPLGFCGAEIASFFFSSALSALSLIHISEP